MKDIQTAPNPIVTGQCRHCAEQLMFESAQAGQTAQCPNCGAETMLEPYIAPPEPPPARPSSFAGPTEPLREKTAYPRGRQLLKLLEKASKFALAATLILAVELALDGDETHATASLVAIAAALGDMFIWMMIHESGNALLDMADIAMQKEIENRKTNAS